MNTQDTTPTARPASSWREPLVVSNAADLDYYSNAGRVRWNLNLTPEHHRLLASYFSLPPQEQVALRDGLLDLFQVANFIELEWRAVQVWERGFVFFYVTDWASTPTV